MEKSLNAKGDWIDDFLVVKSKVPYSISILPCGKNFKKFGFGVSYD